jgi:hypothetical protein
MVSDCAPESDAVTITGSTLAGTKSTYAAINNAQVRVMLSRLRACRAVPQRRHAIRSPIVDVRCNIPHAWQVSTPVEAAVRTLTA